MIHYQTKLQELVARFGANALVSDVIAAIVTERFTGPAVLRQVDARPYATASAALGVVPAAAEEDDDDLLPAAQPVLEPVQLAQPEPAAEQPPQPAAEKASSRSKQKKIVHTEAMGKVLALIEQFGPLTMNDLVARSGDSPASLRKNCQDLIEEGSIHKTGATRGTLYIAGAAPEGEEPAAPPCSPEVAIVGTIVQPEPEPAAAAAPEAPKPPTDSNPRSLVTESEPIAFSVCACGLKLSAGMIAKYNGKCPVCGKPLHFDVKAPPPPAMDAPPTCETCGAKLTLTSLGTFYPCGHRAAVATREPVPATTSPANAPSAEPATNPARKMNAWDMAQATLASAE